MMSNLDRARIEGVNLGEEYMEAFPYTDKMEPVAARLRAWSFHVSIERRARG